MSCGVLLGTTCSKHQRDTAAYLSHGELFETSYFTHQLLPLSCQCCTRLVQPRAIFSQRLSVGCMSLQHLLGNLLQLSERFDVLLQDGRHDRGWVCADHSGPRINDV